MEKKKDEFVGVRGKVYGKPRKVVGFIYTYTYNVNVYIVYM